MFLNAPQLYVHTVHPTPTPMNPFPYSPQIEEVPGELTQDDLATDDVMILDTWEQVEKPKLKLF